MEVGVYQPAPRDYMSLQYMDKLSGGRLRLILNDHGARGLTICPLCKIGDFMHVKNCRLSLSEEDMNKIYSTAPLTKLLSRKTIQKRVKGIKIKY